MKKAQLVDEENPWTTLSSQVIYDNPWIHVREDKVLDPKGNPTIYGVVGIKNLAIGIVPLDDAMNTWLIGQYRYPLGKYSWEIVEGGGPFNRPPLESAKRELKEEAGLEANEWTEIIRMQTSNCIADETAIIYIARDLTIGEPTPDDNEKLQIAKVPFMEAYRLMEEGRISDSMSVAALQKIYIMMKEGKL